MKFKHNLHGTSVLELSEDDLKALGRGEHLKVNGMLIGQEIPDVVRLYKHDRTTRELVQMLPGGLYKADLKVTYDGRTGDMVNVEILT